MHVESFPRITLPALLLGAALALACGGAPTDERPAGATGTETLQSGSAAQAPHDPAQAQPNGGGNDKVLVCHIPPGNPANAHTISVGAPAVPAHLAHGDTEGCCTDSNGQCTPDTGTDNPDPSEPGSCKPENASCGEGMGTCCQDLICGEQSTCVPNPIIG